MAAGFPLRRVGGARLLPMFRGRGLRRRFWLVRGARPGKPGRQTAAASRRTPHELPRRTQSADGLRRTKKCCRARSIVPLRLAIFRSRGFDFEDAGYLVPRAASMRRRDRTHARRGLEGVIPRAVDPPGSTDLPGSTHRRPGSSVMRRPGGPFWLYWQGRARRIRSLRLLAES